MKRDWQRWFAAAVVLVLCSVMIGCGASEDAKPKAQNGRIDDKGQQNLEVAAEVSLAAIEQLIAQKKFSEAQKHLRAKLLNAPQDVDALSLSAQAAYFSGDVDQAVTLLDAAADAAPEQRNRIGGSVVDMLASSGRWADAIKRSEDLVNAEPENVLWRHQTAALLNQRGFRFDANEHVRELCLLGDATPQELQGLISPVRSFTGFAQKPDINDPQMIQEMGPLNAARGLFSEGDVREAEELLRASELIKQKHPAAMAIWGQVLIETQQFDRFEAWLRDVPSAADRYPAYWMAMGAWMLRERDNIAAVGCFAEAVLREPGDEAAVNRITQALKACGEDEMASRFGKRLEQINRSRQIVKQVIGKLNLAPGAVVELSKLLSEADRPLESLAWYRIAAVSTNAGADVMTQIQQSTAQLKNEKTRSEIRMKQLCRVDLDLFPIDSMKRRLTQRRGSESSVANTTTPNRTKSVAPVDPIFVNVAKERGIDFRYRNAAEPVAKEFRIFEAYGAGVACLDFDLNGDVDFYIGQSAGEPPGDDGSQPNRLTRNVGDGFVNVTDVSGSDDRGYACGMTSGDWNQDGFPDLLIANLGRNVLMINQGDGTFRSSPAIERGGPWKYTTSAAIADVTGDHLPDIVEVNYLDDPGMFDSLERDESGKVVGFPGPLHFQPAADRVFVSVGDGQMQEKLIGASGEPSSYAATGLGLVVTDIDGTAGNEIFVTNDLVANQLWQAGKPLDQWRDVATTKGLAYSANGTPLACMGIAAGDFDGNGRIDFHVPNFEDQWSGHYMQNEAGLFDDLVVAVGLGQATFKMLGFGTQAIDCDNNGESEIVVGNGHVEDFTHRGSQFAMPTQLFRQDDDGYVSVSVSGDDAYWQQGHLSRGLAICDWNNDGLTDFAVTDLSQPFALLENRCPSKYHWVQLKLVGTISERGAIGARVVVTTEDDRQFIHVAQTGDGYMSRNQDRLFVGLGDQRTIKHVTVRWPDGATQQYHDIQPDGLWLIVQGQQKAFRYNATRD